MCDSMMTIISTVVGGTLSLIGSIIAHRHEIKRDRIRIMLEKQLEVLGEASAALHMLVRFTGEGSRAAKDIDAVNRENSDVEWSMYKCRWDEVEPRLWILGSAIREKIFFLYDDIYNGTHDTKYESVFDELNSEIEKMKTKLMKHSHKI